MLLGISSGYVASVTPKNTIFTRLTMNEWDERRFFNRTPTPRMDWDKIRRAKIHCVECDKFEWRTGGCKLGLLAGETCKTRQLALC